MVMTQWYDILGVIGAIFTGIVVMLVLVVYLEQWLARPDPPPLASSDGLALDEPDRNWVEQWAPDLSVQASASFRPRAKAPGVSLDRPAARGVWARVHVFVASHRLTV
jgi:hypothetical protein